MKCTNKCGKTEKLIFIATSGLKLLVYGVSGSAFQDYFQMGESTALLLCCEKMSHVISESAKLTEKYLQILMHKDAR
jgi:hypothetical protein